MAKLWIGCSGYYNRHWKEVFYPADLRQKDWFSFYSQHLNSLELNTTFYKFPTAKSLEKWYHQCTEDFNISVKAPRLITHFKKLNECEILLDEFYGACADGLKEKLGCVLFQFPPSFHFSSERLQLILASLNPGFRNVVEFRHVSWWDEEVLEVLEANGITFCRPDHPTMPNLYLDESKFFYIRLHGNPVLFHSPYSVEFLNMIKQRLLENTQLEEAYIYFNNTASTAGIENALEFKRMMESVELTSFNINSNPQ